MGLPEHELETLPIAVGQWGSRSPKPHPCTQWDFPNPLEDDAGLRTVVTLAFNATSIHALPTMLNTLHSAFYEEVF